jgi:hypothetical protein
MTAQRRQGFARHENGPACQRRLTGRAFLFIHQGQASAPGLSRFLAENGTFLFARRYKK